MDLLEEVKGFIRVSSQKANTEVQQVIDAAIADMGIKGVENRRLEDPLILQAIKLYAKANYGFDPDADKWQERYEQLRDSLSLSGSYNGRCTGG